MDGLISGHRLENAFTLDTNQNVNGTVHLQGGFDIPNGDLHLGSLNGADWIAVMEMGVHPALLALPRVEKNVTINNFVAIKGKLLPNHVKVPGEADLLEEILGDLVYSVSTVFFKFKWRG